MEVQNITNAMPASLDSFDQKVSGIASVTSIRQSEQDTPEGKFSGVKQTAKDDVNSKNGDGHDKAYSERISKNLLNKYPIAEKMIYDHIIKKFKFDGCEIMANLNAFQSNTLSNRRIWNNIRAAKSLTKACLGIYVDFYHSFSFALGTMKHVNDDVRRVFLNEDIKIFGMILQHSLSRSDQEYSVGFEGTLDFLTDFATGAIFIVVNNKSRNSKKYADFKKKNNEKIKSMELAVNAQNKSIQEIAMQLLINGQNTTLHSELITMGVSFLQLSHSKYYEDKVSVTSNKDCIEYNEKIKNMPVEGFCEKVEPITRLPKNKTLKTRPDNTSDRSLSASPERVITENISVIYSDYFTTQMATLLAQPAYASLNKKIDEIINDLKSGKKLYHYWKGYCFADLPGIEQAKGRGKFRLVFKRSGGDQFQIEQICQHKGKGFVTWGGEY